MDYVQEKYTLQKNVLQYQTQIREQYFHNYTNLTIIVLRTNFNDLRN